MIKKTLKSLLIVSILLTPATIFAQGMQQATPAQTETKDYSDAKMEKFSDALEAMSTIQGKAQQRMKKAVQAEGMDMNTYQKMAMSQRNPNAQAPEMSAEEKQKMTKIQQKMQKIQAELQPKMMQAIEDSGMELAEYKQMFTQYQQSPEMQKEVKEMMN